MKRGSMMMEVETQQQQQQRKRIKTTQVTSLKDVPDEIMSEILLRIPADNLVDVKVVSKLWYRLISDQKFVRAHLNRNQHQCEYQQIIFHNYPYEHQVFNLQHEDVDVDVVQVPKLNFANIFNNSRIRFHYCCDGLFLFESYGFGDNLYICNPVTGKCTILPIETSKEVCISDWILTRDDSVQKYKVVGFTIDFSHCAIYTLHKHNEEAASAAAASAAAASAAAAAGGHWTEMDTGYDSNCISTPTLLDNELHWLATSFFIDDKIILCSMDVSKEEFRGTRVPFLTTVLWRTHSIMEVMGSFCVTDYFCDRNHLDIWTSQDKGKSGIWTKIHSITCDFKFHKGLRPHFSSSQTKILVNGNNQVFVYDFKYKDWKKIDFPVHQDMVGQFVHSNSLVNWD